MQYNVIIYHLRKYVIIKTPNGDSGIHRCVTAAVSHALLAALSKKEKTY